MKNKKLLYGILIAVVVVVIGTSLFILNRSVIIPTPKITLTLSAENVSPIKEKPLGERISGVPDPASVYCRGLGYKLETRTNPDGGKYGVCIFPDGSKCGQWDFFRGKCGQKFTFCEQQGFRIESRIDNMGTWTSEYAVCIFDDSSECLEQNYFEDKCNRSECRKWKMSEGGCINSQ